MKQRTQNFLLGLTAIGFLVLFLVTFIFLYPALHGAGRTITIHFPHEEGMAPLKVGSPVLLAGSLEVGRVQGIRVQQTAPRIAGRPPSTVFVVRASIQNDVPLFGNCEISTNQPAIGGSGYVSILNVGTPDVPFREPVQGLPPQSMAAMLSMLSRRVLGQGGMLDDLAAAVDPDVETSLMHKLSVSLDDVNALTRELRNQLSPADQHALLHKVHRLLDDFNAATAALRAEMSATSDTAALAKVHLALERVNEGLAEATALLQESRPTVRATLDSVQSAAQTVDRELLATLRAELSAADPTSMLGKLHVAADRVNASLEDIQAMTAAGERLVAVNRPTLERTLANFQTTSEQLKQASAEVMLNPSVLIWPPGAQRREQLLVFQAARSFAEAAGQLDDAAGRLEAILATLPRDGRSGTADRQELEAIHTAIQAAFQRFEQAERNLWDRMK